MRICIHMYIRSLSLSFSLCRLLSRRRSYSQAHSLHHSLSLSLFLCLSFSVCFYRHHQCKVSVQGLSYVDISVDSQTAPAGQSPQPAWAKSAAQPAGNSPPGRGGKRRLQNHLPSRERAVLRCGLKGHRDEAGCRHLRSALCLAAFMEGFLRFLRTLLLKQKGFRRHLAARFRSPSTAHGMQAGRSSSQAVLCSSCPAQRVCSVEASLKLETPATLPHAYKPEQREIGSTHTFPILLHHVQLFRLFLCLAREGTAEST